MPRSQGARTTTTSQTQPYKTKQCIFKQLLYEREDEKAISKNQLTIQKATAIRLILAVNSKAELLYSQRLWTDGVLIKKSFLKYQCAKNRISRKLIRVGNKTQTIICYN